MAPPTPTYAPRPQVPLGGYPVVAPPGTEMPLLPAGYGAPRPTVAPMPPATAPVTAFERALALLAVVGACAVAVSTFAPWITVETLGAGVRTGTGWRQLDGSLGWGPALLALILLAGGCVAPVVARTRSRAALRFGAVAALFAAAIAIAQLSHLHDLGAGAMSATVEIGPWVVLSGVLLALIGIVVNLWGGRAANVTASRAVGAVG